MAENVVDVSLKHNYGCIADAIHKSWYCSWNHVWGWFLFGVGCGFWNQEFLIKQFLLEVI